MSAHHLKLLQLSFQKSDRNLSLSPTKTHSSHLVMLVSIQDVSHPHWASNTCKFHVLVVGAHLTLPQNRIYIQLPSSSKVYHLSSPASNNNEDSFTNEKADLPIYLYNIVICYTNIRNITKRQRQWARWKDKIVPSLIKLYLIILNQMCNLWDPPSPPLPCTCTCITTQKLKVLCVYFDYKWSNFILNTCYNNCLSLDLSQIELLLYACTLATL